MKMKKMLKTVGCLLFTALFFTACKKNTDTTNTGNQQIKNSSKWVFKVTTYNESGAALTTTTATLVASTQTYAGSSWFLLTEQASGTPIIAIQKRSDGWWQIPLPNTTPSLWYKTPASVNDTYTLQVNDGTVNSAKVTNTSASVTVPAGTYSNCTKVDANDTNSLENEFWFTNAGPVILKITEWDAKAAGPASNVYNSEMWELVSFTP